jgi:oligopeptide transport system ATP-binding protein
VHPSQGSIEYLGQDIAQLQGRARRRLGAEIQMVFQDPYSSLHPRMTAEQSVAEGWRAHPECAPANRQQSLRELFEQVGLSTADRTKYPHEFSGGQRQRISIARALAVSPRLLVLDEPVSALDVSIQAQILLLLEQLQRERSLSYLFISHDLDVVGQISSRAVAMYLGVLVEVGPTRQLLRRPGHPYTEALLASVPSLDEPLPDSVSSAHLVGEMPSPISPPSGCRLRTRCWLAEQVCAQAEPPLRRWSDGRLVACHVRDAPPGDSESRDPVSKGSGTRPSASGHRPS